MAPTSCHRLAASRDFSVVFDELGAASGAAICYGVVAGVCGCVGSMCFLSSIELVGVTLSYPVVMGLEMTVGTTLLSGPHKGASLSLQL